jgi:hypothetical protein
MAATVNSATGCALRCLLAKVDATTSSTPCSMDEVVMPPLRP